MVDEFDSGTNAIFYLYISFWYRMMSPENLNFNGHNGMISIGSNGNLFGGWSTDGGGVLYSFIFTF